MSGGPSEAKESKRGTVSVFLWRVRSKTTMFSNQSSFPRRENYRRLNDGVAQSKVEFEFNCVRALREVGRKEFDAGLQSLDLGHSLG